MNKSNNTNTCHETIEQVIDGQETSSHLESCDSCRTMAQTAGTIKNDGKPADYANDFPGLKEKVLHRLMPIFKRRFQAEKRNEASFFSSWVFKLAIATAAVVMFFALSFRPTSSGSVNKADYLPIKLMQTFKMSVNAKPLIEVSIDSPVSLFEGETAQIIVPDGSKLKVSGPARLTVLPRGFHLISGSLVAEVTRSNSSFAASTPHGQIEVLGTIFSCISTSQKTTVKVIQGKVKVAPDNGSAVIITAGETAEMNSKKSSDSETIPSIDSE
jgi:hypothetical protein